jgi:KUP system potassium uptake protein
VNPPQQHGARASARPEAPEHPPLLWTSLVALGIVYGDIGTSPLYAFRESFLASSARLPPTTAHLRADQMIHILRIV